MLTPRFGAQVVLVVGGFGRSKFLQSEMKNDPVIGQYVEFMGEPG